MLGGDDFTRLRSEPSAKLATPSAIFEGLVAPRRSLDWRDGPPRLVVAQTVSMMHGIKDPKLRPPGNSQDLQHMGNAVVRLCDRPNARPNLATFGNEVVIWVD